MLSASLASTSTSRRSSTCSRIQAALSTSTAKIASGGCRRAPCGDDSHRRFRRGATQRGGIERRAGVARLAPVREARAVVAELRQQILPRGIDQAARKHQQQRLRRRAPEAFGQAEGLDGIDQRMTEIGVVAQAQR